ncbi:MAG: hypothetical protein PHE61_07750 [Candidatus Omnitrophica bacterium]|nr:hypothetical protein [Candidatus Omnitrophota bacterium]
MVSGKDSFSPLVFLFVLLLSISCASAPDEGPDGYVKILRTAPKGINYQVLGDVNTHLIKSSFENMEWWKTQCEERLRKKAKELGADALIYPQFDPVSGNASARAIKYREAFPIKEEA